jgi:propionyl-CoA carboxylase beta chain
LTRKWTNCCPDSAKDPLDITKSCPAGGQGDLLEVQAEWARNIVVGFARIRASSWASSPTTPRSKPARSILILRTKGARFIRFCNVFNIPLVTLVDIPGFMPGIQQERGGIIRHGAKMLFAYAAATVPKITVILRKAYGGAYLAMCSSDMGADFVFAWPTAEIAVMGAEGAVKILYKREIAAAKDPKGQRKRNWSPNTATNSARRTKPPERP